MRAVVAALAVLALAGCGGSGEPDLRITLVVEDENIRVEASECAGARPFQYVHAQARYTLTDGDGKVLKEDELPAGRAVDSDPSIDWGVERIPTFCVFELELDDVPQSAAYALELAEGSPLLFDAKVAEGGKPVELTLG